MSLYRNSEGRWMVSARSGVGYFWYRIVVWDALGRELDPRERVHHINGDRTDDRIENLEIMSQSEHMRLHHAKGDCYRLTSADRGKGTLKLSPEIIETIVQMWGEDRTSAEIARAIGWESPGAVRTQICNMRRIGFDLPHGSKHKRTRARS